MQIELSLKNVSHSYSSLLALDSVDIQHQGVGVIALIGANGAGKSTLLRSVVGAQKLSQGLILLNQHEIYPESKYRKQIGYLSEQNPLAHSLTVQEILLGSALLHGVSYTQYQSHIEEVLHSCDLFALRHRYCNTLSRGQRQRLGLASAIVHKPKLLILDEVHSGLDPLQTQAINKILNDLATTTLIILSTHRLTEAEKVAKWIWVLHQGKLLKQSSLISWQTEWKTLQDQQNRNLSAATLSAQNTTWSLEKAYLDLIDKS